MIEYNLIEVPNYGWLCKIYKDGAEIYRGEFKPVYIVAMERALEFMENRGGK